MLVVFQAWEDFPGEEFFGASPGNTHSAHGRSSFEWAGRLVNFSPVKPLLLSLKGQRRRDTPPTPRRAPKDFEGLPLSGCTI